MERQPRQDLQITSLSAALGAQITGLDLHDQLDRDALLQIKLALQEHLVVLVPGQDLSPAQQIALSARFGPVQSHPLGAGRSLPGYPEIMIIRNGETGEPARDGGGLAGQWLCDHSYGKQPHHYAVIHARAAVSGEADFIFANLQKAYQDLSPGMRRFLAPLSAYHGPPKDGAPSQASRPPALHPVVLTHPDNRRQGLYVNPAYTQCLEGLTPAESQPILQTLYARIAAPENTYRHRWQPGDLVLWDSRFTAYYVTRSGPEAGPCELRKTTVAGDRLS